MAFWNIFLITKTCLYNIDPFKPHFYRIKLGFTRVYIIFLFLFKNTDCGYSLEPPLQGDSNEYPQSMFEQKYEKYQSFLSKKFQFLEVEFSIYLNRRVFIMLFNPENMVWFFLQPRQVVWNVKLLFWENKKKISPFSVCWIRLESPKIKFLLSSKLKRNIKSYSKQAGLGAVKHLRGQFTWCQALFSGKIKKTTTMLPVCYS